MVNSGSVAIICRETIPKLSICPNKAGNNEYNNNNKKKNKNKNKRQGSWEAAVDTTKPGGTLQDLTICPRIYPSKVGNNGTN
mmetsp:Transcript_23529/g.36177  ORF Transcript_23529/g.36177 Transcript_23529/m.36177 type:complete len:82 (-) Transcript_23529:1271-1516(-)